MGLYHQDGSISIYNGDLRQVLLDLPENLVDFVVTDPPYGLAFMGKDWDSQVPGPEYWEAIARVCKPGAMMLAFGGTRTWHRLACAIEDAGWEVRDTLMWLQGQGFPKSADVGKLIDKAKGAKREVVGTKLGQPGYSLADNGRTNEIYGDLHNPAGECAITAPATDLAKAWTGWAFALKPAWEPIILAMKPMPGTIAQNAEEFGVAGMNIDACRIGPNPGYKYNADHNGTTFHGKQGERIKQTAEKKGSATIESTKGRWPANLLLDGEAAEQLDEQSGTLTSGTMKAGQVRKATKGKGGYHGHMPDVATEFDTGGDSGGASRFFFVDKSEPGAEAPAEQVNGRYPANVIFDEDAAAQLDQQSGFSKSSARPRNNGDFKSASKGAEKAHVSFGHADEGGASRFFYTAKASKKEKGAYNDHPTVKPVALMDYLLKLLSTPTGGVILDPFAGSGTTLVAAKRLGRTCIGVELDSHNCDIIVQRISEQ